MDEHRIDLNGLYARVRSSKKGLLKTEISSRQKTYGLNVFSSKEHAKWLKIFLLQFANFFAILLMFGSVLSFVADRLDPGEGYNYIGLALFCVVVLNALFTFIQKYQSEKILDSFVSMMPSRCLVIRSGEEVEVDADQVVPGDIILLNEGDKVAADARLVEVAELKVDHAALTGESEPQLRKLACTHENLLESRNMVFAGTHVLTGTGKALVYATGMHTQMGKLVALTKKTKETQTTLHKELSYFIRIISAIAIFLGILFFGISLWIGNHVMASMIFAIGIIVANVPEGLLPTVTLCLTLSAKRMAKKNALIKNLEAVETLGSTTVICTDKTGTITRNQMGVIAVIAGEVLQDKPVSKADKLSLAIMQYCNNARKDASGFHGDPTETALLSYVDKYGVTARCSRVHESPFDSKTKRMIVTCDPEGAGRYSKKFIAYMKGAPEEVLGRCNKMMNKNGSEVTLSAAKKKGCYKTFQEMAAQGQRVLALAYKSTSQKKVAEKEFVLVGFVGLFDPARKEVPKAIKQCKQAGIRVIMITGDHPLTARVVAQKIGMNSKNVTVVTGEALDNLSEEALSNVLDKEVLFARTTPLHKLRIVQALQAKGEIVTVTGDGVNDAPALKHADMGVAMGIIGTDVAREAGNMVLMDDNFATIVHAVKEGRTIFANIKKAIAYILTSNVPEILPFIAFVLLSVPLGITVVLILAIDLGTDLLPALGLGTEEPEQDVMKLPPRSQNERLLTPQLLGMTYGFVGMLQAAAGFFSFFWILLAGGWQWGQEIAMSDPLYRTAVTGFFASIVITQVADVLICRTRRQSIFSAGLFSNKLVLLGIFSELLLLAFIVYVPFMQVFLGTMPLAPIHFLLPVPFALMILFIDEGRKWLVRKENRFVLRYLSW